MSEFLKTVDTWFLVFLVIVLGSYFLYSIKQLFKGLSEAITELKDMIKELFRDRNEHAVEIASLKLELKNREEICNERHAVRSGTERRKHTNE